MSGKVVELERDFETLLDNWRIACLGDLCRINIGGTPSRHKPEYWTAGDEGHPWVAISDLRQPVIVATKERITDAGVANSNVKLVKAGTIMMSFKLTIGRVAVAGTDLFTNEAIAAFVPTEGIDTSFLPYWLAFIVKDADTDQAIKGVTLNKQKLATLSGLLPPMDEQRRIAEVLRSVDKAIAAADLVARQWATTFEKLLDVAFASGERAKLGDICSLIYRYPGFYGFDQFETGVPVIRGEHLRAGRISRDWSDFYFVDPSLSARFPKTILELNDVVMSVRGTVGTAAVVDAAHVGSQISPNLIRLVADPAKIVPPLLYFAVQSAVAHMRRTIVNAQALPAINAGDLKQVEIALPALGNQPALLAELNGAASATADAVLAAQQARQTKALLMSDLLSGRVRVPA